MSATVRRLWSLVLIMANSPFFALLSRIRWINRWGLMRNAHPENVMEHSWEVAVIAHALAVVSNLHFDGEINAESVATKALFHDVTEVITGDMPTPIKYHSDGIKQAFKSIEKEAATELIDMLPPSLRSTYQPLIVGDGDTQEQQLIHAADKITAYLKCISEQRAGNHEFDQAAVELKQKIDGLQMPEVDHFMKQFSESYSESLDQLRG